VCLERAQSAAEEPAEVRTKPDEWQLCAEVGNETWMAWGTVEVPVALARLRSVQSELRWSLGIAGAAAAFWLLALPAALTVRFATIPSGSMEPTVHQGPCFSPVCAGQAQGKGKLELRVLRLLSRTLTELIGKIRPSRAVGSLTDWPYCSCPPDVVLSLTTVLKAEVERTLPSKLTPGGKR
jgi:hypothetical protein